MTPPDVSKGRSLVTFLSKPEDLDQRLLLAGNAGIGRRDALHAVRALGRGHVVAFTDDPNYRAMYPATQRLFLNAVLFGPGH